MTDGVDDQPQEEPKASGPYEVGYRKPPLNHQYQAGRSGNPRGRPRKIRLTKMDISDGIGKQLAKNCLIEEAYRPISVREGDRIESMPVIQAIYRSMILAAAKGNRLAAKLMTGLVQAAEAEDYHRQVEFKRTLIEYRCDGEQKIENARRAGIPEPELFPHPEDVFLDFKNDIVEVRGPMTKQEKVSWDQVLADRDALQRAMTSFAGDFRRARGSKKKEAALVLWKKTQKFFDEINDQLPPRYQAEPKDRVPR